MISVIYLWSLLVLLLSIIIMIIIIVLIIHVHMIEYHYLIRCYHYKTTIYIDICVTMVITSIPFKLLSHVFSCEYLVGSASSPKVLRQTLVTSPWRRAIRTTPSAEQTAMKVYLCMCRMFSGSPWKPTKQVQLYPNNNNNNNIAA